MTLMCGCGDDEAPDIFRQTWVKAKKEHRCYECKKIISPGDDYEYIFGVWWGDASSYHTCEKCADLRDSLQALGFCSTIGDLLADHKEYLQEYVNHRS